MEPRLNHEGLAEWPALTPLAAAVMDIPAPERALQIECGDGDGVMFLAREFPSARVRGADRSPEKVDAATARVGLDPEGRVAFKLAGRSLPYPDRFFDLAVQVAGRLRPAEVARVLKPGGHLVLVGDPPTRKLRRHRFEVVRVGAIGTWTFSVARLREPG